MRPIAAMGHRAPEPPVNGPEPKRTLVAQAGSRQPHVIAVSSYAGGLFRTGPIWPPQFPKISQERFQNFGGFNVR
jgi:hypothetical protein